MNSEIDKIRIFALSGSLRKASYNSAALCALQDLAPDYVRVDIGGIGDLPLFNPDLEETKIQSVLDLKKSISQSAGLILASPEYAHGISGPMKNALDWLVSDIEFPGKKIMLVNTSPRATHALCALKEVLVTMSAEIVESACVSIPLLGSGLDANCIEQDRAIKTALREGLVEFVAQIEQ